MTWADKRGARRQAVRAMTSTSDIQTVTGTRAGTIKLGRDVHASSIVVVRQVDAQGAQPAQRFTPEQFLSFVRKQFERAAEVHSCYEAGPFGYAPPPQMGARRGSEISSVEFPVRHRTPRT